MNVFAKFDEIPSMILKVIKETKHYGHTVGRMVSRTIGQRENSIPSHKHSLRGYNYQPCKELRKTLLTGKSVAAVGLYGLQQMLYFQDSFLDLQPSLNFSKHTQGLLFWKTKHHGNTNIYEP